jgi:uncharacterized protein (TIGR04255 family)
VNERRQYRNPPIQEALCEIQFSSNADWDPTIPGRLYERLRDSYSGAPRQQLEGGFQLAGDPSSASLRWQPGPPKVQFVTPEGDRLLSVGSNVLSVHILYPYRGWEEFRPRIEAALSAYEAIASPDGIRRIGVRYINRIIVKEDRLHLGDFFTTPPELPDELDVNITTFLLRIEAAYTDEPIRLIQTYASAEAEAGSAGFILDLDVIREWQTETLPIRDAMSHIDRLRDRERDAFEALITENARELFDAD